MNRLGVNGQAVSDDWGGVFPPQCFSPCWGQTCGFATRCPLPLEGTASGALWSASVAAAGELEQGLE